MAHRVKSIAFVSLTPCAMHSALCVLSREMQFLGQVFPALDTVPVGRGGILDELPAAVEIYSVEAQWVAAIKRLHLFQCRLKAALKVVIDALFECVYLRA